MWVGKFAMSEKAQRQREEGIIHGSSGLDRSPHHDTKQVEDSVVRGRAWNSSVGLKGWHTPRMEDLGGGL